MPWNACGAPTSTSPTSPNPTKLPLADFSLVAVGRLGRGPEADLFARYNARLRPNLRVVEVADARGSPPEIKRREAAAILAAVPPPTFLIALDLGGRAESSDSLAHLLTRWTELARPLAFTIGGAEGLDAAILTRADFSLSLGPLTWPHMMVRVLLAEQLFRAQSIAAGHPYHRAGRP